MIDLFGNFIIILSIISAMTFAGLYFLHKVSNTKYIIWENTCIVLQQGAIVAAFGLLLITMTVNLLANNYALNNTSFYLPWFYRFASAWSSHQGSFLLWIFEISIWTFAFIYFHKKDSAINYKSVLAQIALLQTVLLMYLLFASNPYSLSIPVNEVGGMSPLLHHPGLVIHPPILFFGYAGFSIVACIGIAGLLSKNANNYLHALRFWAALSLAVLTVGILLGAWWAYQVLGWGGWWFWDPVENASLLPWLSGLCLLHLIDLAIKQNKAVKATFLIATLTFIFALFATFLVRSGILISVHAFSLDPLNSKFLLVIFILILFYVLFVYVRNNYKGTQIKHFSVDKPSLLLFNISVLMLLVGIILLALFYPLILEIVFKQKISIGAPYYVKTFVPIALFLIYCCSYEPMLTWQHIESISKVMIWFCISLLLIATAIFYHFVIVAIGLLLLIGNIRKQNNFGKVLAHAGLAIFVIVIGLQKHYNKEKNVELIQNKPIAILDKKLNYIATTTLTRPGFNVDKYQIEVTDKNRQYMLYPEIRYYNHGLTLISHPAIKSMWTQDFYLVVTKQKTANVIVVRAYQKPLMWLLWGSGLIMALGILFIVKRTPYQR